MHKNSKLCGTNCSMSQTKIFPNTITHKKLACIFEVIFFFTIEYIRTEIIDVIYPNKYIKYKLCKIPYSFTSFAPPLIISSETYL